MKALFPLVLFFRLPQKFWGDMFMRWHSKQVQKLVDSIDIDVSQIKIVKNIP